MWRLFFRSRHRRTRESFRLWPKAEALLAVLAEDPFQDTTPFEKLLGDLAGAYSRRTNIQHRLVYQVLADQQSVKVSSLDPLRPTGGLQHLLRRIARPP